MAQQGKKKRSSGSSPAGKAIRSPGIQPGATPPARTAVGNGPQGSAIRRQSVAANRGEVSNNKTQLYILGAAVLVILAVVVVGIVWNKNSQKAENDGYGNARNSVATIDAGGTITVSYNDPPLTIDIYEDPICPYCGALERQYGQQIAQAVDEGKLGVRYHLLTFLDGSSGSGSYSSRASAALMCAATNLGSTPGLWTALHTTLYSVDVQPTEGQTSDMTDAELNTRIEQAAAGAGLAADSSGVAAARSCVDNGSMAPTVKAQYDASATTLTAVTGGVRSPVVLRDGVSVNTNETPWLTTLLG